MKITLSFQEILFALNKLNIPHEGEPNSRGYLSILCPLHNDKNFGNAGIDIQTGVINCFSCGNSEQLINLVKDKLKLSSFKEAFELITQRKLEEVSRVDHSLFSPILQKYIKKEKTNFNIIGQEYLEWFNPKDFPYTNKRGFYKEFCETFNIKRCVEGYYKDYFIIPVEDKRKKIYTFEARKLFQREYLIQKNLSEKQLKELIKEKKLYIKDGELVSKKEDKIIFDSCLKYLVSPKVLYPSGTMISETIWNVDNLNFSKDLVIAEGLGSTPKVYKELTKNVTSIFGTEYTEGQIEILKRFRGRKIIISDDDLASFKMIENINNEIENVYVFDVDTTDTDRNFISNLKQAEIIKATKYLIKKSKIMEF